MITCRGVGVVCIMGAWQWHFLFIMEENGVGVSNSVLCRGYYQWLLSMVIIKGSDDYLMQNNKNWCSAK